MLHPDVDYWEVNVAFDIYDVIASDNYICINRDILLTFGVEEAVLLGELASEYKYYESRGELKEGMFFSSVSNIEARTGLNKYKQSRCLKALEERGIVSLKYQKNPNRRYIELNGDRLQEEVKNLNFRSQNFKPLKSKNLTSNKKNNIRTTTKDSYSQECKDVIDYLNEQADKRFTYAESNLQGIRNRLKEGHTVEDCKMVIDNKVRSWSGTQFEAYIRPSTLFRPKNFEAYLNERGTVKKETHDDRYIASQRFSDEEIEKAMGGIG